jgi:AraC-like DNA-binding protein
MDPTIARLFRFSTENFPEDRRIEMYREIYGRTIVRHDIEPIGDQPFHFDATMCSLPGLGLASATISPCHRWHRPEHIDSDDFILGLGLAGEGAIVHQRGREARIRQGEAVLTSMADPIAVTIPSTSRPLSLRIPNAVLRSRGADLDAWLVRRIPHSAAGRLLAGYVAAVWDAEAMLKPGLCEIVVAHVHDLVCLTLDVAGESRELAEQRGGRAARLSAILRAVESRSGDPGLNATTVAALLGVTPRYVHQLLEETGKSFTHHLLERRLQRAAALLADPRWRERRIADLAAEVGFNDLSYFNRAFRRRYDATPSEIREKAMKSGN